MKIHVATLPAIPVVAWLRRYATELIVLVLVLLATFGAGVAQALYSTAAPQTMVSQSRMTAKVALDQHERHLTTR